MQRKVVCVYTCTHTHTHSWPLNNAGFDCTGPLICGNFSTVNTTVLHGLWLVESVDEK